ncbi:MAG: DUF429 domain-containing protein [Planctomycetota bacterium]
MPRRVAGLDGCRGGWVVVIAEIGTGLTGELLVAGSFVEAMAMTADCRAVAVDMPIGLLDEPRPGGRDCDIAARRLLPGKTSSVFSPPCRAVLHATTFDEVRGRGMTIQSFHLLPKIREVDAWMTPEHQSRVFEAHPELAFLQLGQIRRQKKKSRPGARESLEILGRSGRFSNAEAVLDRALAAHRRAVVSADDVLDAIALTATAVRFAAAQAKRLPAAPQLDAKGLRQEIWY